MDNNKDTVVLSNLDEVFEQASRLDSGQPYAEAWHTCKLWCGETFELRKLEVGNTLYVEQLMRTHRPDLSEMVVCLELPNREGVLDKIRPEIYSDCDDVICDCNKEPWPWLELLKERTKQ